jgi:2-methylcitrate dehydratase PrpD
MARAQNAGLTSRIADFSLRLSFDRLSPGRQSKVRWILADYLGCTLAGSSLPEAASGYVLAQPGPVKLPGDTRGLTPEAAAVAMGTVGALLQIHDGFGGGGNHPCSSIVSALWAARGSKPLADLLLPIAVGYETACRIAKCSHPAQTRAGTAPTSTTGAIGATAALGALLRLDRETLNDALSIAAFSLPVAALRGLTEHGSVVPIHGGLAARTALEAVRLAQAGLSAGNNLLEGGKDPGLVQVLRGNVDELHPETWQGEMLDGVYFKPLPACRHAQPAIEAILNCYEKGKFSYKDVEQVLVHTYPMALTFGDPPRESHELYDRLMSMPWAIASCLVHGGFAFDNVTGPARDPRVEGLYGLIAMKVDGEFEKSYPKHLSSRVEIRLKNGEVRSGECLMEYGVPSESGPYSPLGTTTPPLDEAGMRRKFFDLAGRRISRGEAEKLLAQVFETETVT